MNRPANAAKLVAESSGDNIISSLILDPDLEGWYNFDNAQTFLNDGFRLRFNDTSWKVVLEHDAFDYYLSIMLLSKDSGHDFPCNDIVLRESDGNSYKSTVCENFRSDSYDGIRNGVRVFGDLYTCKVPESFSGDFWVIYFDLLNPQTGILGSNCYISINLFQVQKNTSAEDVQRIINAINNQTDSITGSIDQNTDDIQQSIEDQYEVDPDEDFGVGSIIEEYDEKVGLLTFASDTFLGMLDLFSPENSGEPEIVVPSWSMEIQGTNYKVWDEYRFNLRFIDENFPFLMKSVRLVTVSLFYLGIVKYIKKIAERWFLAR